MHLPVQRAPRDGVHYLHRQLPGVSLAGGQLAGQHAVRDACDDQGSVGAQVLEFEATVPQDLHSTGLVCDLCVSVPQMPQDITYYLPALHGVVAVWRWLAPFFTSTDLAGGDLGKYL